MLEDNTRLIGPNEDIQGINSSLGRIVMDFINGLGCAPDFGDRKKPIEPDGRRECRTILLKCR